LAIDVERSGPRVDRIAQALKNSIAAPPPPGILRVANANMERAIRLVSVVARL